VDFLLAAQPKERKKLEQHHGAAVREQFLKRLAAEIERRGALDVLRSGIKDSGCKFRLAYSRPASGLNEDAAAARGEPFRSRRSSHRFKSTLRWSLEEDRQDDQDVTHAVLTTIAASLNTEGGDLLIGVANDGAIVGIERDRLESDDTFMRHLALVVRNGLGDRAQTCIDPKVQIVEEKTVCVVSCQRSPEPVFLQWKGMEVAPEGDFFVRSGPAPYSSRPTALASTFARGSLRLRETCGTV
jgi:hypothetical protein